MREFTKITIREWLSNYETGKYSNSDFETMCDAGWYDWFCSDEALANKLRKFAGVIKNVTKNNDFLLDNFTLRFKNLFQCGSDSWYLYDMIRFAPMDEQEKDSRIFIITIGNKRTGCTYGVWAATKKYAKEYNCNYQKELIPYMHKISAVLQAEYSSANK